MCTHFAPVCIACDVPIETFVAAGSSLQTVLYIISRINNLQWFLGSVISAAQNNVRMKLTIFVIPQKREVSSSDTFDRGNEQSTNSCGSDQPAGRAGGFGTPQHP